jgi:hypothetical protein
MPTVWMTILPPSSLHRVTTQKDVTNFKENVNIYSLYTADELKQGISSLALGFIQYNAPMYI